MRRVFSFLLFCLCFFPSGPALAWEAAQSALIWQGFVLSGKAAASAAPEGRGMVVSTARRLPDKKPPAANTSAPATAEVTQPAAGPFLLAFTLVTPPGVYLYGPDAKDGLPTSFSVSYAPITPFAARPAPSSAAFAELLETGGQPLEPRIPMAVLKKNTPFGSQTGFGNPDTPIYPGPVTFWVEVPSLLPFYTSAAVKVQVAGLFCSATSCTPFTNPLELVVGQKDVEAFAVAAQQPWWQDWKKGTAVQLAVPQPDPLPEGEGERQTNGTETAVPSGTSAPLPRIQTEAAKALERHTAFFATLEPAFFVPGQEVEELGKAMFLGLIAGFLLNLMPCVLPVISLKFSALLAVTAMTDKREQARAFRVHCLIFAAGIMTWFMILALLLGVAGLAWGEMFQSPVVIVCLGLVLFLLGLSLFGVFSLPIFDPKITSESHPHWQAFASGLLATLLATPCSGPLLGGVLGWALRQPLPILILTVACVGIGMSLPYGVLACRPGLLHLLPRPGSWTLRLEQLLGFFLMGSVLYLVTLLPSEWVPAFLFNMFAVAVAAWLWGQIGHLRASTLRRMLSRGLAIVLVGLTAWWGSASIKRDFAWEEFDPQTFTELLGTQPLLLEFTADWCPSCKAMEYTTLNKKRMATLREKYKMRTIRVDLTRDAEAGKALLLSLKSGSIPVIALFPKGEGAKKPMVLRDLVTPEQLKRALSEVF